MSTKVTTVEYLANQSFLDYLDAKLQPLLAKQPAICLLEVGCGEGAFAIILQEKYKEKLVYKGIDPSKESTEKAKAKGAEGVESISLEDLSSPDNSYDAIICTKSFHHLASLHGALEKIHRLLKPGGLFIADEFAREAMDVPTATFFYKRTDALEEAGKFTAPNKWLATSDDIKHDYLKRWQIKFLHQHEGGTGEAFKHGPHSHGAHAGHHAHHNTGHGAHVAPEAHANEHGAHETQDAHAHGHGAHGHPAIPASDVMIAEIRKVFPNLEITKWSMLYHFIAQRFEGSSAGEDIFKEFKREEEDLIAKKEIVPIGLRFSCSKQ